MKQPLFLKVACLEPSLDEAPDFFTIAPSKSLLSRLTELIHQVNDIGIRALDFNLTDGHYLSSYNCQNFNETWLTDIPRDELTHKLKIDSEVKGLILVMESARVEVLQDGVRFSAIPKGFTERERCATEKVSIENLIALKNSIPNNQYLEEDTRRVRCEQ